jgi:hypothetical protein
LGDHSDVLLLCARYYDAVDETAVTIAEAAGEQELGCVEGDPSPIMYPMPRVPPVMRAVLPRIEKMSKNVALIAYQWPSKTTSSWRAINSRAPWASSRFTACCRSRALIGGVVD